MCECPPKKKLRQSTLMDMFSPSTKPKAKMDDSPTPPNTTESETESQNIESSIELMKLGSGLMHNSTDDNIEMMDTDTNVEDSDDNERDTKETTDRGSKGAQKDKEEEEEEEKEMEASHEKKAGQRSFDFISPGVSGYAEGASKKKKRHSGENQNNDDAETLSPGGEERRMRATTPRGKGSAKGSTPKKTPKKHTPKKTPGKSPAKDREHRKSSGDAMERRRILAEAAERRMSGQTNPSPEPNEADFACSPDMFDDDFEDVVQQAEESGITWRGTPVSSLPFITTTNLNIPPVYTAPNHTVLVQLPVTADVCPAPHPPTYTDVWDQFHVRMPCSPKSLYPLGKGSDTVVPRWSIICKALSRKMESVDDLQRAILEYNSRYAARWKFRGLQMLLEEEFAEEEQEFFFENTLPAMVRLALNLPKIVTQPLPLLTSQTTHSITLSQLQIASLLANAFFCTFPRRNARGSETEYASYPDINFNRLFYPREKRSMEKIKCLINYFRRVTSKEPTGTVTFTRQYINPQSMPHWETCSKPLPKLHVDTKGLIEEQMGLLQVDFANKYVGGGVLGLGCVQEEIRFVLSPELIVSRLFTQVLDKTEALLVIGVEQFNKGIGYASNFRWAGSHKDTTPRDPWGRRMCQVTAIDALHFTKQPRIQYRPNFILRELNKAYAGFQLMEGSSGTPVAVATGNWGCGAFKGDSRLKSLIQLAVCGYIGRDVAYFTFGDQKLRNDLSTMHIFLTENNVTVGELVQVLNHHGLRDRVDGSDLSHYIYHNLGAYDSETDNDTEEAKGPSKEPNNKNLISQGSSHSTTTSSSSSGTAHRTARSITDYFTKSSSSVANKNIPLNAKASAAVALLGKDPSGSGSLTEEKILQVLTECDRLVEGQRSKGQQGSPSAISLDNRKGGRSSSNFIENVKGELRKMKDAEGNSVSSEACESSKLLSYLDDIDKCLAS
ncbi:poly(ADP-ribose) glycohydrolase-like isoform X2 [Penaeus japonicus]|uniref:poly(ADP-ribose) glycohydrolase-like isoform X2 n=1 Tax=Penaeus japonicus TaxID=27405 RepID=UPI001C716B86|nr:poly(ADP-ribose) glycohydrolase-like isoform X2 [Penaeus japonicus]XP_042874420.1 poly(ADP-ribose) glycohydrolase-like isoform X2 [Penaeus japonicus]XP_042874421.1 poly(ADP-ribose) glycohydrolase-like isoform X2 [Penaeus japonicus]